MKKLRPGIFIILFFAACIHIFPQTKNVATDKNYRFVNGNWFDGKKFKKRDFFSIGGILSDKKPSKIDETIDLENGFVIPPFADAHTHNLDGT